METTGTEFGPWLARQLKLTGKSQTELAKELRVTRAAVSAWVTNRSTPRPEMAALIAEALGTDIATVHTRDTDTTAGLPVGWYHRPEHADGGREMGNAATFAFDADVQVLAREIGQNSLDARLEHNGRPVRLRFTLHEITGEKLADFLAAVQWDELAPHYQAVADSARQKVSRAVKAGLNDLYRRDRLVLLRVDDYNALGLTGDEYGDSTYAAVVRRTLDSHKNTDGTSGGSYGLGKATLWGTSRLGMVLINSTLSEPYEGRTERRVVGRLELPWRRVGDEALAGPSWFGRADPDTPGARIARSWWADDDIVRRLHLARENDEPGTSFLVVGAHDVAGLAEGKPLADDEEPDENGDELRNMHRRLVDALGRNFWAAMTAADGARPHLEASVRTLRDGMELIPEERIDPTLVEPSRTRALKAFLDGTTVDRLTETGQVAQASIQLKLPGRDARSTAGVHKAVLLVTDAIDGEQPVNVMAAMRGNLMTVRTKNVPGLPLGANPFQAVLLTGTAAGQTPCALEAERFLRAAEPPEHNKWMQTEELTNDYAPSAHRRIATMIHDAHAQVKSLLAQPKRKSSAQREAGNLAKRIAPKSRPKAKPRPSAGSRPELEDLQPTILPNGAWQVTGEINVPRGGDRWIARPTAAFDVRSGPRPRVAWAELEGVQGCEAVDGTLHFAPSARSAVFRAVTDPTTQPVRGSRSGLVVELDLVEGDV
ncbi:helix-turn-helix domain-containing protein [Streptomyces iconiensis]|uniref:Helix-turn-helix transcriptional regulator n=1 Tax=Streptomyces iconiensis TaxID=1384038 RepID=A0ABT6ZZM1_9ACTN|nr:helix-turn-helix transcriptional regulator [Streptomyces iconiensis]MDJ1134504.1 helix-turn-helix transcriptional regulator [Streptomyces iconiensis]